MQAKIKIEKTDVKIFELVIDVDENELKQWAIDHYGAPDEFEDDESPDLTLDEDGNEVPAPNLTQIGFTPIFQSIYLNRTPTFFF